MGSAAGEEINDEAVVATFPLPGVGSTVENSSGSLSSSAALLQSRATTSALVILTAVLTLFGCA